MGGLETPNLNEINVSIQHYDIHRNRRMIERNHCDLRKTPLNRMHATANIPMSCFEQNNAV